MPVGRCHSVSATSYIQTSSLTVIVAAMLGGSRLLLRVKRDLRRLL